MSSGNDIIMGAGGPPAAQFPTIGTRVGGVVVAEPTSRQQTDPNTNEPKTFPNGDPMMVAIVQVQTDVRDPANPEDDGVRSLWIGGRGLKAVREACVRAGSPQGVEVGGYLALTYVGDEAPAGRGLRGAKIYSAEYRKPNPFSADGGAFVPGAPVPSVQTYTVPTTMTATGAAPVVIPTATTTATIPASTTAAVAAAAAGLSEEQKAALRAIGMPV